MAEKFFYETVERDEKSEFPLIAAHDTLTDAIKYAEAHHIDIIHQNGGEFLDFEFCPRCHGWHPNTFDGCTWYKEHYTVKQDPGTVYYEVRTTLKNGEPHWTQFDSLDDAIFFAEQTKTNEIDTIGGTWATLRPCMLCGEWFDENELNNDNLCETCEMCAHEHGF